MYPSSDLKLTYETDDSVYFFSGPFDPLDNFSAHSIEIWGHTFPTVEHAFHWKKFETTEPELAEKTCSKNIVENSPVDNFWGCGEDGKGENRMGKILMVVRDEL